MATNIRKLANCILPDLAEIDYKTRAHGYWYIFYTHSGEHKKKVRNLLCVPDKREREDWDDADFFGAVYDLIRDYADAKGIELKGDLLFGSLISELNKLHKGEKNGRD